MPVATYPMSYDAITKNLTIWGNSISDDYDKMGYSEETAFTFDHIKDYALYVGGGIADDDGYRFRFRTVLSRDLSFANESFFVDKEKTIIFERKYAGNYCFEVSAYCTFQLGEVVDLVNKVTKNGCSIICDGTTNPVSAFRMNLGGAGSTFIYSSYIYAKQRPNYLTATVSDGTHRVWNSIIIGGCIYGGNTFCDIYNVNIQDCTRAFVYHLGNKDKIFVQNCGAIVGVRRPNLSSEVRNLSARNTPTMVNWQYDNQSGAFGNFIDCDLEGWGTFSANSILPLYGNYVYGYRRYTVSLSVKDPDGIDIEGATVVIKNADDVTVFTGNTDSEGKIADQVLLVQQWAFTRNELNQPLIIEDNYNPFMFEVSKEGLQTYKTTFDVLEKTNKVIALREPDPPVGNKIYGAVIHNATIR